MMMKRSDETSDETGDITGGLVMKMSKEVMK